MGSRINVYFDGTVTLKDIYDAIVAAGYSTHVFWDGINFVLNGSLYITGSTAGALTAKGVNIILLGTIYNTNANCIITLGESISNSYRYPTTLTFLYISGSSRVFMGCKSGSLRGASKWERALFIRCGCS